SWSAWASTTSRVWYGSRSAWAWSLRSRDRARALFRALRGALRPFLQKRFEAVAEVRLREEAVGSGGEGLFADRGAGVERDQHDERRIAPRLERAGELETVDLVKHGLEDHQVGVQTLDRLERFGARARGPDEPEVGARLDPSDGAREKGAARVGDEHPQ